MVQSLNNVGRRVEAEVIFVGRIDKKNAIVYERGLTPSQLFSRVGNNTPQAASELFQPLPRSFGLCRYIFLNRGYRLRHIRLSRLRLVGKCSSRSVGSNRSVNR